MGHGEELSVRARTRAITSKNRSNSSRVDMELLLIFEVIASVGTPIHELLFREQPDLPGFQLLYNGFVNPVSNKRGLAALHSC